MANRPCHKDNCSGTEIEKEPEYGSVQSGGSYEVYECDTCHNICRSQMSD